MGESEDNQSKRRGIADSADMSDPSEGAVWSWPAYLSGLDEADSDPELTCNSVWSRLEEIKASHGLLSKFAPWELKVLLGLKRPAPPKGWTLREDLIVLTTPCSSTELTPTLPDRNVSSVKKRLQLLKSKGLSEKLSQDAPRTPV